MHETFLKFIEYKECTYTEFNRARRYIYEANQGQTQFLETCFRIVKEVLENMYQNNSLNFHDYHEIYESHGLISKTFENYFASYIESNMSPQEFAEYTTKIEIPLATKIANEVKNADFEPSAIKNIAKSYNFTLARTNYLIKYYFEKVLKISFSEYKKKYKYFKAYITLKMQSIHDFKHAYSFYLNFANESEKKDFANASLQIIKNSLNTSSLKEYLSTINLSIRDFYFLTCTYMPKFKNKIEETFKEYFDFCENNIWKPELISEEAKNQSISYEDYLYLAKIYGTYILHISDIEDYVRQKRILTITKEFPQADILTQIYQSTNEEEYCSLFESISNLGIDIIYRFCYTYNRDLPMKEKVKMENNLATKLNLYFKRKRENNKRVSTTTYTPEVIEKALNSSHTIEQFCLIYGYNRKTLIDKIKQSTPVYIRKLQEKLAIEQELSNKMKENLTYTILNYIKNGFPIGNQILPFTLLDYFILFPNIPYCNLRKNALTKEEAIILNQFFIPLKATNNLSKNIILSTNLTKQITYQGETYLKTFTQTELIEIVDYMEKYQIPFNELLFHQICIRYATTGLDIYNDNNLGLK